MAKRPPIPLNVMELEQIKVLRASGLTFHAISKRLGRDHKTIKKAAISPDMATQIKRVKGNLADGFEDIAIRMVASIDDNEIKSINPYQRTVSAAIAVDKMRLLREQSTQNIGIHTIVERIERKRRERPDRGRQKEAPQNGEE